jgi:hypothetical protein
VKAHWGEQGGGDFKQENVPFLGGTFCIILGAILFYFIYHFNKYIKWILIQRSPT